MPLLDGEDFDDEGKKSKLFEFYVFQLFLVYAFLLLGLQNVFKMTSTFTFISTISLTCHKSITI